MYAPRLLKCTASDSGCEWAVSSQQLGCRNMLENHINTEHPEEAARRARIRLHEERLLDAFDRLLESKLIE